MLLDLPVETVQVIMQTAERQGVSVAELLDKTFNHQAEQPLAMRIHQRFKALHDENDDFNFDDYLPTRQQYARELDL